MNRRCLLVTVAAFAAASAVGNAAMSTVARIHGKVVAIDRRRGTFMIHHAPFAQMPMAMTMEVEPVDKRRLATLHVGDVVDAVVDTKIVPWPATRITRAKR